MDREARPNFFWRALNWVESEHRAAAPPPADPPAPKTNPPVSKPAEPAEPACGSKLQPQACSSAAGHESQQFLHLLADCVPIRFRVGWLNLLSHF